MAADAAGLVAVSAQLVVPFALAGGTLIFTGVIVLFLFAVIFGYYTRTGSGISQTPYRRPGGPPETPSELAHDTTQDIRNWERGTEGHYRRRAMTGANEPPPAIAQALADWRARAGAAPALEPPVGPGDRVRGTHGARTVTAYLDVCTVPSRSAYTLLCEFVDSGQIRLAVRQLPLADVHPLALVAAATLEAAAAQGRFFELLDRIAAAGLTDEDELLALAGRCVEDPDRLQQEVRAGRFEDAVVEQIRHATASGAHAEPEIFIEAAHYDGPITRDDITRALRRQPDPLT